MAQVVAIHGIGQQFKGEHELRAEWLPALRDGLSRVGWAFPNEDDLVCAFYGDLFREKGTKSLGDPPYDASDVCDEWERELLELWWREAARVEPPLPGPDAKTKLRTPKIVQRALNALSNSEFFAGVAERALIGDLKQVRSYLQDEEIHTKVQERVAKEVKKDTRILIGHSLGSVVGYEALCAHPQWPIRTFVTLGSPLGIRNLIFDQLRPRPVRQVGSWPGNVKQWTNISDQGDIVALVKELRPRFDGRVEDQLTYNGATAHDVKPYLSAEETGGAIARGLKS